MSYYEAYEAMRGIRTNKVPGPDGVPALILKMFAELYNKSHKEGYLPTLLKSAAVCLLPRQRSPRIIDNDTRPISLMSHLAKIMEGLSLSRALADMLQQRDTTQFAVAGRSIQHAIVYLLHLALEALDRGSVCVILFFADF